MQTKDPHAPPYTGAAARDLHDLSEHLNVILAIVDNDADGCARAPGNIGLAFSELDAALGLPRGYTFRTLVLADSVSRHLLRDPRKET